MTCEEAKRGKVSIPSLMLREKLGDLYPTKAETLPDSAPVFEVNHLSGQGFSNIDFHVRKGEIVGFFGLVGSGIDGLAKTIFGVLPSEAGEMRLNGTKVSFASPGDALKSGVFLLPGDRRTEGLVMTDNVIFNTTLANLHRASRFGGLLRFGANSKEVDRLSALVGLNPPTPRRPASAFSGGNQQKIVVAKGLYSQSDLYLFVEPTVGVDIGARSKIYHLMRELSKDAAVIVMSSDHEEVYGVADQVTALYRGRLGVPPSNTMSLESLLEAGIAGETTA